MKSAAALNTLQLEQAMVRANELSKVGLGVTSPNPIVGAVIIDSSGNEISIGFHVGGDHAEVVALKNAKTTGHKDLSKFTLVVTLEPCNHFGKTPPCTDAIIESGIKRVVFATIDPHVTAAGGADKLRAAGVEVISGVHNELVAFTNRAWLKKIRTGSPWIVSKVAVTVDGKVAAANGESKWITSTDSRSDVAHLRNSVDAIVTSTNTVLADDPQLTPRFDGGINPTNRPLNPTRIVLGLKEIPANFKIHDATAETLFLKSRSFQDLLNLANSRGWNQVMIESGAKLNSALLKEDLIDELVIYMAPNILGSGKNFVEDIGVFTLEQRKAFNFAEIQRSGNDLRIQMIRDFSNLEKGALN